MSDTKYAFPQFAFYDRTGIQTYLEKQARKGWILEDAGNFAWRFTRSYPRTLHYAVVYFPKVDLYDPSPTEQEETFREFCAHGGWILAGSNAQMQIFYSEAENPTPIETDPAIEVENIHRSMKKNVLRSYWIMLAVAILQLLVQWIPFQADPLEYLSSNLNLFMVVFWIVLLGLSVNRIVNYYHWHKRAEAAAEEDGIFLKTRGYGNLEAVVSIFLLAVLVFILVTMENRHMAVVLTVGMSSAVVVMALVEAFRRKLKREGYDAKTSKKAMAIACAVIALACWGIMYAVILPVVNNSDWKREEAVSLDIRELIGEGEYDTLVLYDQESVLLGYEKIFQVHDGEHTTPRMQYELAKVKLPALYDRCLAQMMDYPSRNPGSEYQWTDPAPWGAEEAWQLHDGEELREWYVLCYEDAIVLLIPDWEMTAEQMAAVGAKFR